jgi:predicted ATPase
MTASRPCSDAPPLAAPRHRLIVLEGMPGAGKTTAAAALTHLGRAVLGEYTTDADATIAISQHPPTGDDDAHQRNWLRKAAQATIRLARSRAVYADRDWLSSLSYAYSIAATDDGVLLAQRAAWAAGHLREDSLLLPAIYVIFDLDPATSLHRRVGRLRPGHPWNNPAALSRLRDFYADPSGALHRVHPGIAEVLQQPDQVNISGLSDSHEITEHLAALSTRP